MNFKRDNRLAFVIALAVTVATLVAGQLLWQKYAVARPLDSGLQGIAGVTAASWDESKNGDITINVTLGGVDNFAKTYGEIGETAKTILGKRPARINLVDSRTPELETLFHAVHFHLQEAVATGNFSAMAERVDAKARAAGADATMYVDARNVYLRLTRGGASLYAVVPRPEAAAREVK
ncbi:hypothetical protein [Anaeroselena agilis]|uniref:Uncharacterized protein n=1 Tax=Anaeroselena agilis TaxID=3063788 RepID=A0ABU3NXP8_9FIRM|nr:hypothetical protein [Selenomonadales bacterium 4137-cl]